MAYFGEVQRLVDVTGTVGEEPVALVEPARPRIEVSYPQLGGRAWRHDRLEQRLADTGPVVLCQHVEGIELSIAHGLMVPDLSPGAAQGDPDDLPRYLGHGHCRAAFEPALPGSGAPLDGV